MTHLSTFAWTKAVDQLADKQSWFRQILVKPQTWHQPRFWRDYRFGKGTSDLHSSTLACPQVHGKKILKLLQKIFSWLPLATVIDQKVLILHGGISDTTDLHLVARVDRHKVRALRLTDKHSPSNSHNDHLSWTNNRDIIIKNYHF